MDDDSNQIQKIDLDKVDWKSSREFFESLGEELDKLDNKDEAYDFTWVGKRKAIIEAGAPINKTLRPNVDESKDWDKTENLFIEGDNLDALKLMQESYLGKVKMIYIDPPYNTGKDFVYHDDFKRNSKDWDEETEYRDEEGNIQEAKRNPLRANLKANGRYHSDWLNMMYPRLKLSRNLLSNDGVIFISIDDNEQTNLKKLCDEIFGEDNFVAVLPTIMNLKGNNDQFGFSGTHEYTLVYGKSYQHLTLNEFTLDEEAREDWVEDEKGYYKKGANLKATGTNAPRAKRPNLYFPLYINSKHEVSLKKNDGFFEVLPLTDGNEMSWRWSKNKFLENLDELIISGDAPDFSIYKKQRPALGDMPTAKPKSTFYKPEYSSGNGTSAVKVLFDGDKIFDNPKPVQLLKDLVQIGSNKDSIIIDFFSGSGTTAHAIMSLNSEDDGARKWIMVQLPEPTNEDSSAFKAGFKTIPAAARERIKRYASQIEKDNVDTGFRALTIADTNYKEVFKTVGQHTQESLLDTVDNVKEDRSELDLLYGVLVQLALELNRPIEKKELSGADVYVYDYFGEVSGLVACFADSVPEETIKEIAKLKPLTAVFKDASFESSQDKVNLAEHFRIISPDTKVKVV